MGIRRGTGTNTEARPWAVEQAEAPSAAYDHDRAPAGCPCRKSRSSAARWNPPGGSPMTRARSWREKCQPYRLPTAANWEELWLTRESLLMEDSVYGDGQPQPCVRDDSIYGPFLMGRILPTGRPCLRPGIRATGDILPRMRAGIRPRGKALFMPRTLPGRILPRRRPGFWWGKPLPWYSCLLCEELP